MNFARVGLAGLLAAAVTFGLFALMQGLIAMNLKKPEEAEEKKNRRHLHGGSNHRNQIRHG
jgi:hypothetical protein